MLRYYATGTKDDPKVIPATDSNVERLVAEQSVVDAQIQALTERNEFLEDLIAELAIQAYSKSPSA